MRKLRPVVKILLITLVIIFVVSFFFVISRIDKDSNNQINSNNNSDESNSNRYSNQVGVVTNIWIYNYSRLDVLVEHDVKYLFIDIGGTNEDGTLENSFEEIEDFLAFIEEYQIKRNYSFILLPYSEIKSDEKNITDDEFRDNFIRSYKYLVERGYDGVLVDIEPVNFSERDSFVDLLYELREDLPNDAVISVYTGHISEHRTDNVWEWDEDFYRDVALVSDIISAPLYDTDFKTQREYREHIINQLRLLSEQRDAKILMAIPTHKEYPELSGFALDIVSEELPKYDNDTIIGVTIFAEWTAEEGDWENLKAFQEKIRRNDK